MPKSSGCFVIQSALIVIVKFWNVVKANPLS